MMEMPIYENGWWKACVRIMTVSECPSSNDDDQNKYSVDSTDGNYPTSDYFSI